MNTTFLRILIASLCPLVSSVALVWKHGVDEPQPLIPACFVKPMGQKGAVDLRFEAV